MNRPENGKCCGCRAEQAGFSLVAAIFLIVALAALGAFAVQVAMTQYQTASMELVEARAQAAAQAGAEYGANRALRASSCNYNRRTLSLRGALTGFVVMVTCTSKTHPVGTAYLLIATATSGSYGAPDYVARTVTRNVTTAP